MYYHAAPFESREPGTHDAIIGYQIISRESQGGARRNVFRTRAGTKSSCFRVFKAYWPFRNDLTPEMAKEMAYWRDLAFVLACGLNSGQLKLEQFQWNKK